MTTVYNHMYTIAFTVVSKNDAENVTEAELLAGLANRERALRLAGDDQIIAACGLPHDTYTVERTPAEDLLREHGANGEHATHNRADWRWEVAESHTNLGYWDWVAHKLEENS